MKKYGKTIILCSLLFASALFCGAGCSFGSDVKEDENGFTYESVDGGYAVSGVKEVKKGKIVIPDKFNGKAVVAIAEGAFKDEDTLVEVVMPNSLQTVGVSAFADCDQLQTLTFGSAITEIENKAFENCLKITEVELPDSLISIGSEAFTGCNKLKEILLPDSVETVGEKAFYGLEALAYVEIGDGLKQVKTMAFADCEALKEVKISDNAPLEIGEKAFYSCQYLHTVTFGKEVKSIGVSAFASDIHLTEVKIGDKCRVIATGAFSGNFHLTSVTLGTGLASIGNNAFNECQTLVEVCNKSDLNVRKGDSGNGGVAKKALNVCEKEEDKKLYVGKQNVIYYQDGEELIAVGQKIKESGVALSFEENTTQILPMAFYNNNTIASVTIGDKVKSVGRKAFSWCTKIKTLVLGDSVTELGVEAFYSCTFMDSVVIGSGLKTVADNAFYKCNVLTNVFYKGTIGEWEQISFGANATKIADAKKYFYSETQPTGTANYWYYDENGALRVW